MRVVSSIINDISTDQRVMKQAAVLKSLGCNVTVVCRRKADFKFASDDFSVFRFRFLINKGPLFYLVFNIRLLIFLLFKRYDIYVANDLDTLLPNYIVSRLRRKPLVYDSHEYFTGQHGLMERRFAYSTWKKIERSIVPGLRYMITVSDSIAGLYNAEYGVTPEVIRNMAYSSSGITPVRLEDIGITNNDFRLVIQGAGLNPGRGVLELLDALRLVSGVHLVIIGSGDALNDIKMKISSLGLNERVTLIPQLPWGEMMRYTLACDAGISLDKDTCINQKLSLPNKLFDYLSAGIPVIASPLPEVSKIINEYKCGIVAEYVTPESISRAIIQLRDNKELTAEMKKSAKAASGVLNWERESIRETAFFRKIIDEYRNF